MPFQWRFHIYIMKILPLQKKMREMIGIRSNPSWPGVLLLCINSLHLSHGTHLHSALKRHCRKQHKGNQAGEMPIPERLLGMAGHGDSHVHHGEPGTTGWHRGAGAGRAWPLGWLGSQWPLQNNPHLLLVLVLAKASQAVKIRRAQPLAPAALVKLEKSPAHPGDAVMVSPSPVSVCQI